MYKFLALVALTLTLSFVAQAQDDNAKNKVSKIKVVFQNKSLLPKKCVFITYEPSVTGNGTTTRVIAPKGKTSLMLEAGTKVFIANTEQVDYVMTGANLSERKDKPFCVVAKAPSEQKYVVE